MLITAECAACFPGDLASSIFVLLLLVEKRHKKLTETYKLCFLCKSQNRPNAAYTMHNKQFDIKWSILFLSCYFGLFSFSCCCFF